MCQIYIIRKLKYERTFIQTALKTLPQTLYETYDRIVQTIPEEDRLFVYYVLRWIAFRNEVPLGKAFPYKALVGAAEASILRLTGVENVRLYDRNGLADVCGCLINIGSLKSFSYIGTSDVDDGVTFAHYSVQEYLHSNTNLDFVFGHPTLIGEDLKSHLLDITLTEAHRLNQDELSRISSSLEQKTTSTYQALLCTCRDFRIYSISLASMSLYCLFDHICRSEALEALAIDFLDPSKTNYPVMEKLIECAVRVRSPLPARDFRYGYLIWNMKWDPETDEEMIYLGKVLFLATDRPERLSLAKSLMHRKDCRSLLQTQACLSIDFSEGHREWYTFRGFWVEIFAQLAFSFFNTFEFLMEISADLFDPSIVLAKYIGRPLKDTDKHDSSQRIQRLLELGAGPTLQGYKTTPLQIACLVGDSIGVGELLKAHAQPNDTGTPDGIAWDRGTLIHDISQIHGANPLRICKSFRFNYVDVPMSERQKVEELLLSYGAEDFILPSCVTGVLGYDNARGTVYRLW